MKKTLMIALLTTGWTAGCALAQTTLQVVSKNIEKTIPWKPGMELIVNGEKADVTVSTTDATQISVLAELNAKHPSLDTAQADVETWQFIVSTLGKKIYLRAYVGVQAGKRVPASNMKARIEIKAPKACPINLSNRFGKAKLENLEGTVALNGYFCRFDLQSLGGALHVESEHGAVDGHDLKGAVDIKGKRIDVTLQNTSGDCSIQTEYGTVQISTNQQTGNVHIVGQKTDVTLLAPDNTTHNYRLKSRYGTILAPGTFDKSGSTDQAPQATYSAPHNKATIDVETSFGAIKIEH